MIVISIAKSSRPDAFLKLLLGLIESLVYFLRITSPALRLNLFLCHPFIVSQIRDPIRFEVLSTIFLLFS